MTEAMAGAGCDAAVVVTPCYYKGLYSHLLSKIVQRIVLNFQTASIKVLSVHLL